MDDVVVSNVSVAHGGRTIIPDISFSLKRGELCGLIGANGVGKTTLLRAVIGLETQYRGSILLAGREIRSLSQYERASWFAYLPQKRDAFVTGLTVAQVVESGLVRFVRGFRGLDAAQRRTIDRAISLAGIDRLSDRFFDELSGGEQQKVLIASALAQGARYLILDEPTTFLDLTSAHGVMQLLRELILHEGVGVWVVCHDVSLILAYGDRVLALSREGGLVKGTPAELSGSEILTSLYGQPLRMIPDPLNRFPCIVPQ